MGDLQSFQPMVGYGLPINLKIFIFFCKSNVCLWMYKEYTLHALLEVLQPKTIMTLWWLLQKNSSFQNIILSTSRKRFCEKHSFICLYGLLDGMCFFFNLTISLTMKCFTRRNFRKRGSWFVHISCLNQCLYLWTL